MANQFLTQDDYLGILKAAIKSMDARYKILSHAGEQKAAEKFLLSDFDDRSQYISHQHYNDNTIDPCIESTYHFFDVVIDAFQMPA